VVGGAGPHSGFPGRAATTSKEATVHVDDAIRHRRSHKVFTGEPMTVAVLRELIELARWAPNHGLTEPWRFHAALGPSKDALATVIDATLAAMRKPNEDGDARLLAKRTKMKTRIAQAGAVVAVTCPREAGDPLLAREDYGATCCAIQNLSLAATARGLASYWSTGKALDQPAVRAFWGLRDDQLLVGTLCLGVGALPMKGRRLHDVDELLRLV